MNFTRAELFGFDFISAGSVEKLSETIIGETLGSGTIEFLITPNAYQVVHFSDKGNSPLKDFYRSARYILPDGMPIVWLGKMLNKPLEARLTGSDLFPVIWNGIKQRQIPVTLVLPSEQIAVLFGKEYELCNYVVPRFFKATDHAYEENLAERAADAIIQNNSRFIFLGLGFPKQELLGMAIEKQLKKKGYTEGCLFLLLGASFEFYFGL